MRRVACLVVLAACGRIGFDASGDGGNAGDLDSSDLPAGVCRGTRTAMPVGTLLDIAAVATPGGGVIVATVDAGPANLVLSRFSSALALVNERTITNPLIAEIGSLADNGTRIQGMAQRKDGDAQELQIPYDLSSATLAAQIVGIRVGTDCLTSDGTRQFFIGILNTTIFMYRLDATGMNATYNTATTLAEHTCVDGPGHVHVAWRTMAGTCFFADVLTASGQGMVNGTAQLADCRSSRGALGMPALDDGMGVYETATGAIAAQYVSIAGGPELPVSAAGRSPRIVFDGARFHIAWIDTTAGNDVLHVGTLSTTGVLVESALPMLPVADAAYEFVRGASPPMLAVREADALNLLELCP